MFDFAHSTFYFNFTYVINRISLSKMSSTVYLQVEALSKSFGSNIIFDKISFGVSEGEKIGIIAKNGSGKSTLMNILVGNEGYDAGKITFHNNIRIGYLPQMPTFNPEMTILEACLNNNIEACKVLKNYEKAIINGDDLTDILTLMDSADAWTYEERFKRILTQLKLYDLNSKINTLSGGQIKRIAIASLLMQEPDFIMLDEPTNHLDIDMIEWLESYLTRSKATLLMVTHDRYFLDKICNKIIEINESSIYSYLGNYDYYLEKRSERLEMQDKATDKAKNLFRKELDWMRRQPQARASKSKYRIDAFYDLKEKATNRHCENKLQLNNNAGYIGSKIFVADAVSKKYGETVILDNFNYIFSRYEKVGIVGANGVGKSTFIKLLQGIIKPDSGQFEIGETVKFGYYKQENEPVDESKKVIDLATDIAEVICFDDKNSLTASQFLNHFLFKPSDQQKYVYKLSGGEKRRLQLALMLMKKPNFLILDEPTNDLDIVTLEVLEDYLEKFKGCAIIISHDRFFMDRSIDHLFVFEGNGVIKDFPGSYSDYRLWKQEQIVDKNPVQKNDASPVKKSRDYSYKLSYKEKKEFEILTSEIEALEQEKKEIEKVFNGEMKMDDGKTFDSLSQRFATINNILEEKEMRWLELSEKE